MYTFLRAQYQHIKSYSIKKKTKSGFSIMGGIFLLVALLLPKQDFAVGFNGGTLVSSSATACSGSPAVISFTATTCALPGPDFSATYFIDSSFDGGSTWFTPTGVTTGNISAAAPTATYTSPVLTATTCRTIYYRLRLTAIVSNCSGPGTTFTSNTLTLSVCPQPAPITGPAGGGNLCIGNTITLSDATAGGVWSIISSTPGGVASVSTSGVVTALAAGTATIAYTLGGGCSSTYSVTVNPAAPAITGSNALCVGATANYTVATPTAGTWASSTAAVGTINAATGVFTAISAGTTTITFTVTASGCFSIFTVSVNALPSAIGGNAPFCEGTTITLTNATGGGTYSSSMATVATVNPTTGVVTGTGGGNATITYTLGTSCFATAQVTVNPAPSLITGTPFVCIGSVTTLGSTPPGGTWTGDNASVATVGAGGDVLGLSAGTVTVSYTLATGCRRTTIVTVNPVPATISGTANLCVGTTTTLTDASGGGTWISSNTAVATIGATSGVVSALTPGTTTISYVFTSTGCAATLVVTVNNAPPPSTGIGALCPGMTSTLTNAAGTGTFMSSNTAVATVGSTTGLLTAITGGTTNISFTLASSGCTVVNVETVNPAPAAIMGLPNTCVGFSTHLTDATPGGTWSSSNIAVATVDAAGNVAGLAAGTTIISYTLPSGCAASVVVTVDGIPTGLIGTLSICLGSQTTLSYPTPGGTFASSDTLIAKVFLGTGLVTGVGVGTATITYTLASGCTATGVVTVNPVPAAITGTLYLCAGATTTLSDATAGGTWSSQNNAIATVGSNTGVVTGVGGGVDVITYTLPAGCFVTANVTVYALPAISGTPLVCPGTSVTLTGTPSGGFWSSTLPVIATVGSLSGVVTGVNTGTTVITYALPTTCLTTIVATVQALPSASTGANHVCVGLTTVLSNGTTGGGTWSSSNTAIATVGSTTGVVTGVSAGVVQITFTSAVTGCYSTFNFTVNPLPVPITGPTNVCVNDSITLSDANPGGTWSGGSGFATVNPATGVVTGVAAGVAVITYTLPTTCITTYQVTVNPLPDAITGPAEVCYGNTIVLSSSTPGGVWTVSPASVATISPVGVLTGLSTGTAIVSYTTFPTGCAATLIVTVDPLPAPITGLLNLCVNDSTTLHDTVAGGTWTSDNILIAVINPTSGLLATVTAGTVDITYTLPTGCYVTAEVTVNPRPQPIDGPTAVCVGQSITLTNVTTGGSWSSSNTTTAVVGSDNGIVTGINPGTVFITYTLPSSCPRVIVVTVNPVPGLITGDSSICLGNTTQFFTTSVGGTWSSGNPMVAITILTTGVTFSISVGTAIISYIYPTGCYSTTTLNVNPVPTRYTIGGDTVLCVGSTGVLTNPAFSSGTWSVAPGSAVAVTNPATGAIAGIYAGTASVTYTLPTGCDTTVIVTVNPLPGAITGPGALCANGNNITLTSTTGGGTWTSSNLLVADIGLTTGIVTSHNPGTTTITYTLPTGCRVTRVITVNPNPLPITGLTNICLGLTTVLMDGTPGGTWSSTNTMVATVVPLPGTPTSGLVSALSVGTTTISYTLPTGCASTHLIIVNPLPGAITGSHTVCVADSTQLSEVSIGGTWSSGTPAVASIDSVSGEVFGISAGTSIITYKLSTGCLVTFIVTVNPLPPPIFGPGNVCVGFTIALHDTLPDGSNTPGTWTSVNNGIAIVGAATGIVTGISPGIDTIRFGLATGCYVATNVMVNPIPVISVVSTPTIICKYASTHLTVTGAGPGGTYTWSPATGLDCTTCATVTANPLVTTTYTIVGTTQFGCTDTTTVTVVVDSALNHLRITGDSVICIGECTKLVASGREGTFFNWHPNIALSCTVCDSTTACPLSSVTYVAVAIDSMGCRDSVSIFVDVKPLPNVFVTPKPAIVCRGGTAQLHAVDSNAISGGTRFAWFPNIFISCDTCANPTVSDTFNLVYRVTGITQFGCVDSIKVPVTVLDSAINTINPDTTICLGTTAQLYSSSFNADGSRSDFLWLNTYTLSNSNIPNPTVSPSVTTTYPLLITPNVCFPDTLYTTVKVVPSPGISITPLSATVASGTPVALTASINNDVIIQSYAWSPPQTLSCEMCYNTIATPITTTTYTFTAISVNGCSSSGEVTIHVFCESAEVFIPNTFTPNGDGMNDRFYVSGKGISEITKMQVFNRWGELVYERHNIAPNDPSAGWDGQFRGIVLEPDVFVYIVEATCSLGEHFTYKGDVSLLR